MTAASDKSPGAYRTISEVADGLDLPQHVLRFWETRFPQIKPLKRGGGRRYYRPEDVELLVVIKKLLYDQGYTIRGVQRMLREQGAAAVTLGEGRAAVEAEPSIALPENTQTSFVESSGEREAESSPLDENDIAALQSALADIREAERQLRRALGDQS